MNFLAHLTLSWYDAELQQGNYLGDFVKGRAVNDLPQGVRTGVDMHREIDRLTDTSPAVRSLNRRLAARHGRYAGVVTDIGFDYFLYRHWDRLGPLPFPEFCQLTYRQLATGRAHMPDRVAGYVDRMVRDNWLDLYTTPTGMRRVFERLRPRLSRPHLLNGVDATLRDFDAAFDRTLRQHFPELQTLADRYREPA